VRHQFGQSEQHLLQIDADALCNKWRGYDWTRRYPAIAITATQLRARNAIWTGRAWLIRSGRTVS
jgi:hypothetical protein